MSRKQKWIIFDFGNVLINLDFERCFQNFEDTLQVDWSNRKIPVEIKDAIVAFDKGKLSKVQFAERFRTINSKVSNDDIYFAWNSLLLEIPPTRFKFLESLRSSFNIALLSNINELHLNWIEDHLLEKYGIKNFGTQFFDKVFYSHHISLRKPEDRIYQYVMKSIDSEGTDILFIDDMEQNIQAARNFNWNGIVHNPKDDIESKLDNYLSSISWI